MLRYLPFLLIIALTIYAFIDCLNTPEEEVKHLPKVVWVLIILLFSIVGPVVWLFAGRTRAAAGGGRVRRGDWVAPDDNPEFLRSLREERERDRDGDRDKDRDKDRGKDKDADND
ncbi:PLD nuclease N-terminal domain-containing protein [Streptomyces sp. NPDC046161]|uniref:PLD nuclease N-terminal domain-containing protein n=1 Tax=Streptomyces sp. NPDC046161 TaxID=3155132 RepID=UPI0033ECE168